MSKQKLIWACKDCGHKQIKWSGSCSTCGEWNTFAQEIEIDEKQKRFDSKSLMPLNP